MTNTMHKKGQITIFVIVALIIVLSLGLIFYTGSKSTPEISVREDPKGYMQKCIKDALILAQDTIIPHGGFANPSDSIMFDNKNVVWMCYTSAEEELCINKHPVLKVEMEKEITTLIKPIVEKCFNDIKVQFAKYDYAEEDSNISTEILLDKIQAKVRKKITFTQNEQTIILSNFDSSINSPLYNFAKISLEIINEEVTCNCLEESCNADLAKLNRFNRDFEINKPVYGGDGQEIYTIKEILSGKQFNFALRNCVRLP